jgi:hypothetical protein
MDRHDCRIKSYADAWHPGTVCGVDRVDRPSRKFGAHRHAFASKLVNAKTSEARKSSFSFRPKKADRQRYFTVCEKMKEKKTKKKPERRTSKNASLHARPRLLASCDVRLCRANLILWLAWGSAPVSLQMFRPVTRW